MRSPETIFSRSASWQMLNVAPSEPHQLFNLFQEPFGLSA